MLDRCTLGLMGLMTACSPVTTNHGAPTNGPSGMTTTSEALATDTGAPAPTDAGTDASTAPAWSSGETCLDAIDLAAASGPPAAPYGPYSHAVSGAFGSTDDYNPLGSTGMSPGCALAFDSRGAERVFSVTLQPGETLRVRLTLAPAQAVPSLYVMEGCPVTGWPDVDGSGACGDNEYATEGYCPIGLCAPLEWAFTWPAVDVSGAPTTTRSVFLVADEVNGTLATDYTLEWQITAP